MSQTVLVALITALTALAGMLVGQFVTLRQDDKKRKQQRQDKRDDDRLQRYADLLLVLDDWQNALDAAEKQYEAFVREQGEPDPDDEDLRRFDPYRDTARRSLAVIDLIASSVRVRSAARETIKVGEACYPDMFSGTPSSNRFREYRTRLTDAMRDELRLE